MKTPGSIMRAAAAVWVMTVGWAQLGWVGAAGAQEVPFTGIVVEEQVPVRAGAGRAYYVVGEVNRNERVRVEEVIFGWNKIVPPEGAYSFVSKAFVDARGDGSIGVVNGDNTEVKAASVKGPGDSYRAQKMLSRGDRVQIVGEEGSYYRIVPPEGAYVFIRPGSIRRAEAVEAQMQAAAPEPEPAPQPRPQSPEPTPAEPEPDDAADAETDASDVPASDGRTEPGGVTDGVAITEPVGPAEDVVPQAPRAPAPADPEAPADAQTPPTLVVDGRSAGGSTDQAEGLEELPAGKGDVVSTRAASARLRKLEERMIPLLMQPLEDQPIEDMITAYQAVQDDPSLPAADQRLVALRLATLRRNRDLAEALAEIGRAREEVTTQQAALAEALAEPQPAGPVEYDAVGKLVASGLYDGENLPRMYRLVDPAGQRTLAYVRPGGPIVARTMLGQVVGIVGQREYDPSLKLRVFTVERIDVLGAGQP